MIIERHQLAGVDDRERGFTRLVDVEQTDGMFQASLQYEETRVISGRCETTTAAVLELARLLQDCGYSQLRTQLNFRGDSYLGTQELWVEYPDPKRRSAGRQYTARLVGSVRRLFSRLFSK
jgi:hypothetical protein